MGEMKLERTLTLLLCSGLMITCYDEFDESEDCSDEIHFECI